MSSLESLVDFIKSQRMEFEDYKDIEINLVHCDSSLMSITAGWEGGVEDPMVGSLPVAQSTLNPFLIGCCTLNIPRCLS